jgi:NAD(P)-dependent dehydrogenase (short-subunit alcohol dehydrogenase family)
MNKIVVLSGATGGLGQITARAFAERGDSLALLGRKADSLDSLARALNLPPDRISTHALDLLDAPALHAAAEAVTAKWGAIHILIHLVGGWTGGQTIAETAPTDFQAMIAQHAQTTFNLFQAFVPFLLRSGWGRVITVSAPVASRPVARRGAYAAGKAAQDALVLTLAEELRGSGVTANILVVNSIDLENKGTGASPQEIIAAMLYLCSDAAARLNGARLPLL